MKHIKLFENFKQKIVFSIAESEKPADMNKWVDAFLAFLDKPWQEDREIAIVEQLSEYKDKYKSSPNNAWNYLQSWNNANKELLGKVLGIMTSEQFAAEYDALVNGQVSEQTNESYHDMQYDGKDMVAFKQFINTSPVIGAIYKDVHNTVDGVEMDMLMNTYKRAKEEAPDEIKKFDVFLKKNEPKKNFADNLNLIIVTDDLKAYRVNNKGFITQKDNKDFSGGWRLTGIADIQFGRRVMNFADMDPESIKKFVQAGLKYKNGKPKFTVTDNDHGTNRSWGRRGIGGMYFEEKN